MYEFQIKVKENRKIFNTDELDNNGYVWRSVRPSGSKPYQFKTHIEADKMMRMCYPLQIIGEEIRVIEVIND